MLPYESKKLSLLFNFYFPGLFERHKLLFSFNMTVKIEQAEGRVPQEELDFFLKGDTLTKLMRSIRTLERM